MHERQPNIDSHKPPTPIESAPTAWIPDGLQEALDSDVFQTMDHLWGVGEGHFFGPIGECRIAFYPEHQTIEYENLELYLVFKKPSRLTLAETAVYIDTPGETQTSFFSADRDGGVSLVIKPKQLTLDRLSGGEALEAGRARSIEHQQPRTLEGVGLNPTPAAEPITEELVSEAVAPWEVEGSGSRRTADSRPADLGSNAEYRSSEPTTNSLTETPAAASLKEDDRELSGGGSHQDRPTSADDPIVATSVEPTKKARVELQNARIGRLPIFKSTKTGKRMGRFPVAEHVPDAEGDIKTIWYNVAVFNAVAERLEALIQAEELKVGDEVRVAGYPQTTHVPDGKGGLKEQEVIFAAHVGKPKQKGEK
jgi:hypothetical protein